MTPTHHFKRVMDNYIIVWMALKVVLDIYDVKCAKQLSLGMYQPNKSHQLTITAQAIDMTHAYMT